MNRCAMTISRVRRARFSTEDRALSDNLLKLRAVLFLLAARHGSKLETTRRIVAEIKGRGLRISVRSVHRWRARYLCFGFAGIARRRRNDRDCPHAFSGDMIPRIVDAALRVRRRGDVSREFRKLHATFSYATFRFWVRRVQRGLRLVEIGQGEERIGILL